MKRTKLFGAALAALILPALVAVSGPAEAKRKPRRAKITGKVNLNTAPVRQLSLLPRIGRTTAKRIVAYRAKQRFHAIRDLMRVKGVGKRTFLQAKPHLSVRGPNTIRRISPKKSKKRRRRTPRRKGRCRC